MSDNNGSHSNDSKPNDALLERLRYAEEASKKLSMILWAIASRMPDKTLRVPAIATLGDTSGWLLDVMKDPKTEELIIKARFESKVLMPNRDIIVP